jgi:ComF family protein
VITLLKKIVGHFYELIYPNLCLGCLEKSIAKGKNNFCFTCHSELAYTNDHEKIDNDLMYHFYGRVPIQRGMALLWYSEGGVVQNMIHNLKYKGMKSIGNQLGVILGDKLFVSGIYKDVDALIPVPMHYRKQLERGFNQAEVIAQGVSTETNIIVINDVLTKEQDTSTQTKKTRQERVNNAIDVYKIKNQDKIKGKHIMLIDDVVTTGSTLESCALVLLKNGASKISIGCLAMGNRFY